MNRIDKINLITSVENLKCNSEPNTCKCDEDESCLVDGGYICKCIFDTAKYINNIDDFTIILMNKEYMIYQIYHNKCFLDFLDNMYIINNTNAQCNICEQCVKDHMYDGINYDLCIPCYYKLYKVYNNDNINKVHQ